MVNGAKEAWEAITSVFGDISGWFKEQFTKAWQAVKNVFSTGGKIFDGIKEGILSGLKTIVNAIIKGINKVISVPFNGINSALRSIKNVDILGLQPFSWLGTINVPQIPQLAKGNVAYEPLFAMFGEYSGASNNPEITTPQNIMAETFESVLSRHGDNESRPIQILVQYLGKTIFDETIEYINDKTRRTGKDTIITVGG